jgi:formylglycine-generating enzyme required for sulfatase activity
MNIAVRGDMLQVPGGVFRMGSLSFYPEEQPVREVRVEGFWIDRHPVTNREFARFVAATGYVSVAERPLDPADFPGADSPALVPGSLVFMPTAGPVDLRDFSQWWSYVPGARWDQPLGPDSSIDGLGDHPVVHVAYEDAEVYAAWAGKALPTEVQWEYAARGGLDGATYAWGDEFEPEGRMMANTWQGEFPWQNLLRDGYERTSPVGSFPANSYGLYDMTGNVWEWTQDWWSPFHAADEAGACCAPSRPRDPAPSVEPGSRVPRKVIKGGSHLCAPNYCLRYRPAARSPEAVDTSTSHIGFRCVVSLT